MAKAVVESLAEEKPRFYTYEDYPPEDLFLYAGIDCIVTSDLASKLIPEVAVKPDFTYVEQDPITKQLILTNGEAPSILDSYLKYMAPAYEFILDLELNGIKFDVAKSERIKTRMETELNELEAVLFRVMDYPINLDSGAEIRKYVYTHKGIEAVSFTKTNEASTDGDALKELAGLHPEHKDWLPVLAKRNDIASLYRTFVRDYVRDFVKPDGRIHPSYNLHGTSSFRISGNSPNLTQLPRPKHGYNLREFFTVDDGYVFMAFDFSSAEVKILGALCKDPALLKAIREKLDFHAFSASNMFGIDYDEFMAVLGSDKHPLYKDYKEKRQISKVLTFSILYGSSPTGIANQLGVTKDRAEELTALYFNLFPGIKTYIECTHKMAILNNMVIGPFGQRKMEYGAMSIFKNTAVYNGALRNAQNVRVQNTTSTFGLQCFARANEAIKKLGGMSLCSVYDSIEIQVPIARAAEALEAVFYHMDDEPLEIYDWLELPVGVEAEIGWNWGDAKVIHRGSTQEEIMELLATRER